MIKGVRVVTGFALTAAVLGLSAPALARSASNPDDATASTGDVSLVATDAASRYERQLVFHGVIDPVMADLTNRQDLDGYADLVANSDMTSATLFWKGPVPDGVAEALEAKRSTFPVSIAAARFSEEDLKAQSRQVSEAWDSTWGQFTGISPTSPTMDQVNVAWAPAKKFKAHRSTVLANLKAKVAKARKASRRKAGAEMPLTGMKETPKVSNWTDWRGNDQSPWNSGGRAEFPGGGCTLGPGLTLSSGVQRVLTAGHCGTVGNTVNDGAGDFIGYVTVDRSDSSYSAADQFDAILVGAATSTHQFIGAWNNYAGPTRDIIGWGWAAQGDVVCSEGANSGEHCQLTVGGTTTDYLNDVVRFASASTGIAGCHGDSGAAVVMRGNTTARVYGMLTGGWDVTYCYDSLHTTPGGPDGWFIPIGNVLSQFAGSTVTSVP